jgi:hypothetical protein
VDADQEPSANRSITADVVDISFVGCRLATDEKVEPGTLVAISVSDGAGDDFKALAVVTRHLEGPDGLGVEFFDYVGATRFKLQRFLDDLSEAA